MIVKILNVGKINGKPYEVVIDTHEKHLEDMAGDALHKMVTSQREDWECQYGPFRMRLKPRRGKGYQADGR